jgi:hypothetical protein
VAIDVCLFFYKADVFSATYFRFLFVELKVIGMKIGEAHKTRPSSLQSANTIGTPMSPAPIVMADRTRKKKHNLNIIGAQYLVRIAYWRRGTSVRQNPHRLTVRCASPIFIPIAY